MLAPHHRENAQLGVRRVAAEDSFELFEFLGREVMLANQLRSDLGARHAMQKLRLKLIWLMAGLKPSQGESMLFAESFREKKLSTAQDRSEEHTSELQSQSNL